MAETFKGTDNTYTVLANGDGGVKWGVCISIERGRDFVIRFCTLGYLPQPPKHFNFRKAGAFKSDNLLVEGMYFDKVVVPVMGFHTSRKKLQHVCGELDLPALVGEYVVRQLMLEGAAPYSDAAKVAEKLVIAAVAEDESEGTEGCVFSVEKSLKDIWHEPKVYGGKSQAQTKHVVDEAGDIGGIEPPTNLGKAAMDKLKSLDLGVEGIEFADPDTGEVTHSLDGNGTLHAGPLPSEEAGPAFINSMPGTPGEKLDMLFQSPPPFDGMEQFMEALQEEVEDALGSPLNIDAEPQKYLDRIAAKITEVVKAEQEEYEKAQSKFKGLLDKLPPPSKPKSPPKGVSKKKQ